jgi:dGTPase
LAHDIGNPPFGHAGEEAICSWFRNVYAENSPLANELKKIRYQDFTRFDGNAQGFRLLTQLENHKRAGGLQLTYAVLGTFMKYPSASCVNEQKGDLYIGAKKPGFFKAEEGYFAETAQHLGLNRRHSEKSYWSRHPLAFLVEAADDICYKIIDVEDGYELGYLKFSEAKDALAPIADPNGCLKLPKRPSDQIGKLRAVAIGNLIKECVRVFLEHEEAILDGAFDHQLVPVTIFRKQMENASKLAEEKIFNSERITKLELAGATTLKGLFDFLAEALTDLVNVDFVVEKLNQRSKRIIRLMGDSFEYAKDSYDALLCATDLVSGMTDRFAVETYRTLAGISI